METKDQRVMAIPDFRCLFYMRLFASTALQVQAVIVGWEVFQLTHNALLLGLMGVAEGLPAIACSFVSGHTVDNNRPVLIYRLSVGALFFNTCLLLFAVLPQSLPATLHLSNKLFTDNLRLTLLFTGIFISGSARSFTSPAVFSLIPQIVPRTLISPASAWNSSAYQFASIVGPSLGGLVFGFAGAVGAFAVPPLLIAASLIMSLKLSRRTEELRSPFKREPFFKSVREGIAFAFHHKVLLSTMTLDMFSVLFGGAVAVLPIFAADVFKVGSIGLGFLRTAPSVGSAIVALGLAIRPLKVMSGRALLVAVAGFGLSTICFAVSNNFYLALLFLALIGAFDGVSMVIRSTILQLLTPEKMRGRVSSLSSIFITSSNEIGAFESGVAARFLGLIPSVIFGGSMTVIIVACTAWLVPALAKTRIGDEES